MNYFLSKFLGLIWMILRKSSSLFRNNYPFFLENVKLSNSSTLDGNSKKALMLFKTQPVIFNIISKFYKHTNDWEIIELIKILNKSGYNVDIVDRDYKTFVPKKKYGIFIGIGAGNSGSEYYSIASKLKKCKRVILCLGPDPELSKIKVINRYDFFNERNNTNSPTMRVPDRVDINKFMSVSDIIWAIGENGTFGHDSYKKYGLPLESYIPSVSPKIIFNEKYLQSRNKKKFLCFAGNGFICKGVDVLIEAFLQTPDLNLSICGPNTEKAFFETYEKDLNLENNITYHGFIYPGSKKFENLVKDHSYVVFSSAAEGLATSVLTCMKAGLLPIINYETGIMHNEFGYELKHNNNEDIIPEIIKKCKIASLKPKIEYDNEVKIMLKKIKKYSQEGFSKNIENLVNQLK